MLLPRRGWPVSKLDGCRCAVEWGVDGSHQLMPDMRFTSFLPGWARFDVDDRVWQEAAAHGHPQIGLQRAGKTQVVKTGRWEEALCSISYHSRALLTLARTQELHQAGLDNSGHFHLQSCSVSHLQSPSDTLRFQGLRRGHGMGR